MFIRFSFLITVSFCLSSACLVGQGYRISLAFPDLPGKEVILAHRFGFKFFTDDTVKTDSEGKAVFEGLDPLPGGMYEMVFPDKKFVEFFLDKDQIFNISAKAAAPLETLSFSGSPENSRFLDWQRKYAEIRNRTAQIQNRLKSANLASDSVKLLNREYQQVQQSNTTLWELAIQDLSGTLPGNFIKGLRPVKIPESLGSADTPEGQAKQYQYVRNHFFDGIDFTDDRLLRTPLIQTKLDQYFKQVVPPVPDTIIQDAKKVIGLAEHTKNMYQFVVQYLFNLYTDPEIMGTEAVYVYIAENYYLAGQAPWIDSANLRGIGYRVKELKPLLLGKIAPVLAGLIDTTDQAVDVNKIKSKYLILYFWSPDCGFCKEATPKLHSQYAELKQLGFEVLAINTRTDRNLWVQYIRDNRLEWVNAYSPQKIRDLIELYQAFTTPVMYILDPGRRIIAKNISVDQVKPFFTQYLANHKNGS